MSVGTRTSNANNSPPVSAPVCRNVIRSLLSRFSICLTVVSMTAPPSLAVTALCRDSCLWLPVTLC
jgi:hypothetical protein